jgi:membrane associated rhomboid family serine protease
VPSEIAHGERLFTLFTHMFMHGGIVHLFGNMYFLYVLGDNIEGRFGSLPFLGFYLLCGLAAAGTEVLGDPGSTIPAVGASGAIAGILGAYMVLFPLNKLLLRGWYRGWTGWSIRSYRWEVPAVAYLGFWLLLQLLYAALDVPGVAWWAHIGGFATGAAVGLMVRLSHQGEAKGVRHR